MIKQHILNDLEQISSSNSTTEEKVFEAFKYGLAAVLDRKFCSAAFDLVSEKRFGVDEPTLGPKKAPATPHPSHGRSIED